MTAPNGQTCARDYVDDTGTLTELHTAEALRDHFARFHGRYAVQRVEFLNRHFEDWLVLCELWWEVELLSRADAGRIATFRTAELSEIGRNSLVIGRVGHGTPLTLSAPPI
jgi:hypothetical protein